MSLAEMNHYLLRMYTDDCFRLLAQWHPETTLRAYALSPDEIAAIQDLDPEVVKEFAWSIKEKRLERLVSSYPLLFDHLDGATMRRYADRFYQLHRASPDESAAAYSLAFGDFIEATLAADDVVPRWAADLARYARLDCAARLTSFPAGRGTAPSPEGGSARLREGVYRGDFAYEITAIVSALRAGLPLPSPPMGPQCLLWQRVDGERDPRIFAVSPATARLLALSDGERTVQEIARSLTRTLGACTDVGAVVEALVDLEARGLLLWIEPGRVGAQGGRVV